VALLLNPERKEAKIGSEIKTIQEEIDANQEEMDTNQERTDTIQENMDDGQEQMKAQMGSLASRIDVNQEKTKVMLEACLEKKWREI
jgi:peptidoglycan hydrolase CwlO-like protein